MTTKPISYQLKCVQKCLDDLKDDEHPDIVRYAILCVLGVEI